MTQWLQTLTAAEIVTALVALGAVIGGLKWLRPLLSGVRHFLEDWQGVEGRPGVPGRPGIVATLGQLRCDMEGVRTDLERVKKDAADASFHSQSNHGSSAHDAVIREIRDNARAIAKLSGQVLAQSREMEAIHADVRTSVADRAEIRDHLGLDPHDPQEDQ